MSASGATYVAIITDGNGRWAKQRGLPVEEGHRAVTLGVEHFGQSGSVAELYRHFGIDAQGIVKAAQGLVPGVALGPGQVLHVPTQPAVDHRRELPGQVHHRCRRGHRRPPRPDRPRASSRANGLGGSRAATSSASGGFGPCGEARPSVSRSIASARRCTASRCPRARRRA